MLEGTESDSTLESNKNNGSVSLSYRLDKTLYDLVRKDAREKDVSVNSLINMIVKRYLSWEKYAVEIGFIPLARDTVRLIFEELDERSIKKMARRVGRTIPRELILLMFNRIDFNSIMYFMEITLSRYGSVQHNINGNAHEFVLHHDVNRKFSNFLAEGGKAMAGDLSFNFKVLHADSKILSVRIDEIKSK